MPTRTLRFQGMNPYRNLQNTNPAVGGLAHLGAALINAPATRAMARKQAFDEEAKIQAGLFDQQYKMNRANADDKFKGRTLDQAATRDRNMETYRGDVLKDRGNDRTFRSGESEKDRSFREGQSENERTFKAGEGDKNRKVRHDESYNRAEAGYITQQERERHDREMEGIAKGKESGHAPKAKEAALLAADIWNKSRIAATKTNDKNERILDPTEHQRQYNQLRKLTGRDDIPEWGDVKSTEDRIINQGAPTGAVPKEQPMDYIGSALDVVKNYVGGLFDQTGKSAATPPMQPQGGNGGLFGDQPATLTMDANAQPLPIAQPAPGSPAARLQQKVSRLHPSAQAAFERILKKGDQKRIAAAMERLPPVGDADGSAAGSNEPYDADPGY